jgi:enoyl-CoA hydratase/carnithine racemase
MSDSETPSRITIDRDGGVALVTLRRPERRNALDDRLLIHELGGAWAELAADAETSVVVITGEGKAFCAGADLHGCSGFRRPDVADAEDFTRATLEPVVALHQLPQLTIAAVNGSAVGAGFGMALACDLRFVSPSARFRSPFIHMALVPDYGLSYLLPRLVPMHVALDIMLTGRFVSAEEAVALGLAAGPHDDAVAAAMEYAGLVAAAPKRAVRVTKQALYRAMTLDMPEAVLIEEARSQAVALHGPEFPDRFAAWRDRITGRSS